MGNIGLDRTLNGDQLRMSCITDGGRLSHSEDDAKSAVKQSEAQREEEEDDEDDDDPAGRPRADARARLLPQ